MTAPTRTRTAIESAHRVSDGVTELLRKQPFFGSLALRLPLRAEPRSRSHRVCDLCQRGEGGVSVRARRAPFRIRTSRDVKTRAGCMRYSGRWRGIRSRG